MTDKELVEKIKFAICSNIEGDAQSCKDTFCEKCPFRLEGLDEAAREAISIIRKARDEELASMTPEDVKKSLKAILTQRFHKIATSSDGVFTGYQLDHRTSDDFVNQLSALITAQKKAVAEEMSE